MAAKKKTHEVFGMSNQILPDSYVDRGHLDAKLSLLLQRRTHIALRGESKCGKSWLRQKVVPNAITVQCRHKKPVHDLYVDALSQLDIRLETERTTGNTFKVTAEGEGQLGWKLIAEAKASLGAEFEHSRETTSAPVGRTTGDLGFVAQLIKASGRRLVIEDFHYLSLDDRIAFAYDLKALWDYGLFVIIVGVWSQTNLLLSLNPDLTGRIHEVPIVWAPEELERVLLRGGLAMNIVFSDPVRQHLVNISFENVGILQHLALGTLDEYGIHEAASENVLLEDTAVVDGAAMHYAEQLSPLYTKFARDVAAGIRRRADSTGIYPHAMAAVLGESDEDLINGVSIDRIYTVAHQRQNRIQKGNLRVVLNNFEQLQVDDDGRGLVLSYNDATGDVTVVDRQLLLYRRYATQKWPWADLIDEAEERLRRDSDAGS